MTNFWRQLEIWSTRIGWIGGLAGVIALIISCILKQFNLDETTLIKKIVDWIVAHRVRVSLIILTLFFVYLFLQYLRIRNRITVGFKDSFKNPLNFNWDYIGNWKITAQHELFVTGSDEGGISKKGAFWENYTLTLDCKIVRDCIGIIIRVNDIQNYYMLQINKSKVRPHRRISFAVTDIPQGQSTQNRVVINRVEVGWQVMDNIASDHGQKLDDWFKVKVVVKGQSIYLYINDQLAFTKESFLQIPSGKIGFRNYGDEQALIKNVKVELE